MEVISPSAHGVRPQAIADFVDALDAHPDIEPHGLIIQRHGARIAEGYWAPHTADRSRLVYSLSKTFTGSALALLVGDGRLSLDDLVADHLPELLADADERTRRMRIRHIASMSSGHDHEMLLEAIGADPVDPVAGFFRLPPQAEPGTTFAYNQPPVLALADIVQRTAGERVSTFLRRRLLDPIGIGDFHWTQFRPGLDSGFSGVHTTLDAIARLGQLYLDDGVWQGARLLPEGWVAQASSVQVPNPAEPEPDWRQGYGFQLWMSRHGYRGDGAFGQYMVVLPEHDAVVAMFSHVERMQLVLDLMWEHLLPAMGESPLADASGDAGLAGRLATLALPTARDRLGGSAPSVPDFACSHRRGGPSHRSIDRIDGGDGVIRIREGDDEIALPLRSEWTTTDHLATSATLLADGCLVVDVVVLASPHRLTIELTPADGTFVARWPLLPLFGAAGLHDRLVDMRPPIP